MDTTRSDLKAKEFLANKDKYKQKTIITKKHFNASSKEVFYQLCPSRELDWIDGWACDLIYTKDGYAHKDCIFTTPETNMYGKGTWIFSGYEQNKMVELIVVNDTLLQKITISVEKEKEDSSIGIWTVNITALNEEGNKMIESLDDNIPALDKAIKGLEYFLENGTLLKQ